MVPDGGLRSGANRMRRIQYIKSAPTSAGGSATGEFKSAQAKPLLPLDLARLNGYEVSVLATRGKPVGEETSFVDHIQEWSLNKSGQLIFLCVSNQPRACPLISTGCKREEPSTFWPSGVTVSIRDADSRI